MLVNFTTNNIRNYIITISSFKPFTRVGYEVKHSSFVKFWTVALKVFGLIEIIVVFTEFAVGKVSVVSGSSWLAYF